MNFFFAGLFCLHVIAMLEHLRVDRIPRQYLLNRYSKDAHSNATFDRTDYRTLATDGCSLVYQHSQLLQLAFKLVRVCSKSSKQIAIGKHGLIELIDQVEAAGSSTANDGESPNVDQFEPDYAHIFEDNIFYNDKGEPFHSTKAILPPLVSKTKGSGIHVKESDREKQPAKKPYAQKQSAMKKPPQKKSHAKKPPAKKNVKLDEEGNAIGYRTCSTCNIRDGHNSRTCSMNDPDDVPAKPRTVRKKFCKMCKTMAGHTSVTCPLLDVALQIVAKKNAKKKANKVNSKKKKEKD
jgi:hypothetical protein